MQYPDQRGRGLITPDIYPGMTLFFGYPGDYPGAKKQKKISLIKVKIHKICIAV